MNIGTFLLDVFFPPKCAFCGRCGVKKICSACEKRLPYRDDPLSEGAGYGICASPLHYQGIVRDSILRFKFFGGIGSADGYAGILSRCVAEQFEDCFHRITYVPVSARRKRQRGYDQAQILAQKTAKCWDREAETLLRKTTDNPAQSTIKDYARRRANVLGVYEPVKSAKFEGDNVLLIDDIITTGATLSECARVLRDAGADAVVCAALAATEQKKKPPKV